MRIIPTRRTISAATLAILIGGSTCWAAKMPISDHEREKQATHIITGKVIEIKSNIQQSTVEKGAGNKDEIFSIGVIVEAVRKGKKVKKGDKIVVIAWKPHTRVGLARVGSQGHDPIPKKNQTAEFFLEQENERFKPLMPNGVELKTKDGVVPRYVQNWGRLKAGLTEGDVITLLGKPFKMVQGPSNSGFTGPHTLYWGHLPEDVEEGTMFAEKEFFRVVFSDDGTVKTWHRPDNAFSPGAQQGGAGQPATRPESK